MPESDSIDLDDLICDFQSLLTAIAAAIESAAAVHHAAEKSCFVFDSVILDWTDEECLSEDRLFLATRPTDFGANGCLVLTREEWRADTIRRLTEHGILGDWTSDAAMVKAMRATGEFLDPHPLLRSKQPYRTLPESIVDACERLSLLGAASAKVEQTLTKLDNNTLELLNAFVVPRRWRPEVLSTLDCLDAWPTGKLTPSHLICEDYAEFSCPERMIDFVSRVLRESPIPAWTKIFDATSEWCGQCQSLRLEHVEDANRPTAVERNQCDPDESGLLSALTPAPRRAWAGFMLAEHNLGPGKTDRDLHSWLEEHLDEHCMPELSGFPLQNFPAWMGQLGKARRVLGKPKNRPRAGRTGGRSIVRDVDK